MNEDDDTQCILGIVATRATSRGSRVQIKVFAVHITNITVTFCGPNPGQREISSFDALTIPRSVYKIKDLHRDKTDLYEASSWLVHPIARIMLLG